MDMELKDMRADDVTHWSGYLGQAGIRLDPGFEIQRRVLKDTMMDDCQFISLNFMSLLSNTFSIGHIAHR